jgi:hypothetical protein
MLTDEEVLAGTFRTKFLYTIPRPVVFKTLANSLRRNGELYLELFCANPDHPVFQGEPEAALAAMRIERVRRISARCEAHKLRKCRRANDKTCPHKCPHALDHEHQSSCFNKPEVCGVCE